MLALAVQLIINALVAAAIYALIASGLSFIYATTRVFHLAHGATVAFAAYVFWYLAETWGVPLVLAGVVSCAVAGVIGVLMNEFVYEPLRRRHTKGLGYTTATVALLMLGGATILAFFGAFPRSLHFETRIITLLGVHVTALQIFIVVFSGFLLVALALLVSRTRFGRAMRAVADNPEMAAILGVPTATIRRRAFGIGSALGGLAGVLVALEFNLDANMGVSLAIKGFTAMIIGGPGSFGGVVVGAALLGGVEQAAVWFFSASWKNAVAFIFLFIFLLFRPRGLFGKKRTL